MRRRGERGKRGGGEKMGRGGGEVDGKQREERWREKGGRE